MHVDLIHVPLVLYWAYKMKLFLDINWKGTNNPWNIDYFLPISLKMLSRERDCLDTLKIHKTDAHWNEMIHWISNVLQNIEEEKNIVSSRCCGMLHLLNCICPCSENKRVCYVYAARFVILHCRYIHINMDLAKNI